ncbi:MAG: A/G-specific adenine glycosylase [Bacilli bacterium]
MDKPRLNLELLNRWYDQHHRLLPFREKPSPYGIWVSEVMLQQTQMETVLRYYASFMNIFPTIASLAKAPLEKVLTEVQGLGYYRRFRLLHQGAQYIMANHDGVFPKTYEEVIAIPGVGAYTAGAIMAIAFHQPYPATDGNVIRVLSRFYGIQADMRLPKSRKQIDQLHGELVKQTKPETYIQAVMELGALVCRPINPQCEQCPLQSHCLAFRQKLTDRIPYISKKPQTKTIEWQTALVIKDNHILFVKNETNLLKDFYLLPQTQDNHFGTWLTSQAFHPIQPQDTTLFKHVFTHQTWLMTCSVFKVKKESITNGVWVPMANLHRFPIPEAHQKIIRHYVPEYRKQKVYNNKV